LEKRHGGGVIKEVSLSAKWSQDQCWAYQKTKNETMLSHLTKNIDDQCTTALIKLKERYPCWFDNEKCDKTTNNTFVEKILKFPLLLSMITDSSFIIANLFSN
jgi:hypothetical protein